MMSEIAHEVLSVVAMVAATILTPLIVMWVKKLAAKAGVQLDAAQEEQIGKAINTAILSTEESTKKLAISVTDDAGNVIAERGQVKMDLTLRTARDALAARKLPVPSRDVLKKKVEAQLAASRSVEVK